MAVAVEEPGWWLRACLRRQPSQATRDRGRVSSLLGHEFHDSGSDISPSRSAGTGTPTWDFEFLLATAARRPRVRLEITGSVRDGQVAAGRDGVQVAPDEPVRVVGVRDEVQDLVHVARVGVDVRAPAPCATSCVLFSVGKPVPVSRNCRMPA
jgi:hypothetical protein